MTIELASYVGQLDASYPAPPDQQAEGDDHLRMLKAVLKATFPGRGGPEARTIQKSSGFTPTMQEVGALFICLSSVTVTLASLNGLPEGTNYTIRALAGDVTLTPSGTDTLDGAATFRLASGGFCRVHKDGLVWRVLSVVTPTTVAYATAAGTAAACTGNAATASVAASCSGNSATATTAGYTTDAGYATSAGIAGVAGNASYLQGYAPDNFAVAGHNHAGVYAEMNAVINVALRYVYDTEVIIGLTLYRADGSVQSI